MSDQIRFEVQRLRRCVRQKVLNVGDLGDHLPLVRLERGRFQKVRAHAAARRLRLTHIQQYALDVVELVDAGLVWQSRQLLIDRQARLEHRA